MIDVANRALGTISISVPTSIPLEEVILQHDAPSGDLWINVRSLIRNALNSFESHDKEQLVASILGDVIMQEMGIIQSLVRQAAETSVSRKVVFYYTTRKSLTTIFSKSIPKAPVTPKQRFEFTLTEDTLLYVLDHKKDIEEFDVLIKGRDSKAMIITHQPIDLLSRYQFGDLVLLESHTGKLKRPHEWSSKLSGKGSENLPFNPLTLQIFGDGETFAAYPRKLKVELLNLAASSAWNPITSKTKMQADINSMNDRIGADLLLEMLRVTLR